MIRTLIRHFNSMIIALLLAFIVWSVATSEDNPSVRRVYPEALPVELVNIPEGLVVTQQAATTVKLEIRAPQASWDRLTAKSFRILADLQGETAGLHQIEVKYQIADPQVVVISVDPSAIGIRLEQLKTRQFDVHSDIVDAVPLGFTAKPPVVTPVTVTVTGPSLVVDQVNEVAADVLLRGAKSPFDREVMLVARDAQGNPVQGVTIIPATVTANVQIEQRVGYKDVSIKGVLRGAPATGYWVSNIVVNPSTATVVGSSDVLAQIPGFIETMPVDVSAATADVAKKVSLNLPANVTVLNDEGVTVQVSVTPLLGGLTVPRQVVVQGLRRGLVASISPSQVDVILAGPLPTLNNLSPDDVQVVIDASGVGAGTFQLKPRVPVIPDAVRVQSIVPDSVQVTIIDTTATVTPTPAGPTPTSGTTTPGTLSFPTATTFPTPVGTPGATSTPTFTASPATAAPLSGTRTTIPTTPGPTTAK